MIIKPTIANLNQSILKRSLSFLCSRKSLGRPLILMFCEHPVLREPCCVYKVCLSPLCISEFSLKICTERIVKELVLGTVYRLTTQAQDFSRSSE